MGVKEELPDAVITEIQSIAQTKTWGDRWRMVFTSGQLIRNFFTLDRRIEKYYQRVNQALTQPATDSRPADLSQWHMDELTTYYRQVEEDLLAHWDAPLINDFFAMIFYGLLRHCTEKWCGDETGSLHNALITDTGEVVSAEPLTLMAAMAARLDEYSVYLLGHGRHQG